MTSEQFCTFLAKDVQQDYRQRQSRILCEEIADKLPGRTTLSVTRHLVKRFSVESYPAEWTPDDDEVLRKLVVEFGNQWTVIAGRMGRSAEMTRLRYRDYVSVRFRKEGRWDNDEMEVLYDCVTLLLKENGWTEDRGLEVEVVSEFVDWGSISLKVGQRSRLQCRAKWADLENWREIIGRGD
jgi:hypothetical protein